MRKMFEKSKKMFVLLLAIAAVALSGGFVSAEEHFEADIFAAVIANDVNGTLGCGHYSEVLAGSKFACFTMGGVTTTELTKLYLERFVSKYNDIWWDVPWFVEDGMHMRILSMEWRQQFVVFVLDEKFVIVAEVED